MTEPSSGDVQNKPSFYEDVKSGSMEQVKGLAPWKAGLPWWILLVEGILLALIGLLILIDPRQTSINVALFLCAVMLVAGIMQLLAVFRGKAPESVDALISARGSIAAFTGAMVLLLYFLEYITVDSAKTALLMFSMGAFIFGITGFVVSFKTKGSRRRGGVIEGLFFTAFSVLLLYVVIVGPSAGENVRLAVEIVAWLGIIGGLAIVGLAFFNRSKENKGGPEVAAVEAPANVDMSPSPALAKSDASVVNATPASEAVDADLQAESEPKPSDDDGPAQPSIGDSGI